MKILTVLLLSGLVFSLFGFTIQNDLYQMNLKGKVSSVIDKNFIIQTDAKGEIIKKDLKGEITYVFNEDGDLTSKTSLSNGNFSFKVVYFYETKGKVVKATQWNKSPESEPISIVYNYNEKTNCVTQISYNGTDGSLKDSTVIKYTPFGLMSECRSYLKDGKLWDHQAFYYDESNRIIKDEFIDSVPFSTGVYTYIPGTSNYTMELRRKDNSVLALKECTFDKNGNIEQIKDLFVSGKDYSETYKYQYDKHGNWLSKTVFNSAGIAIHYAERIITYYN